MKHYRAVVGGEVKAEAYWLRCYRFEYDDLLL